jgi:predicted nucleic acid-binding protein
MGNERILIDTNILIEYFRNKRKEETILVRLSENYDLFISVLTKYEFSIGVNQYQSDLSSKILNNFGVINLTDSEITIAVEIYKDLKKNNLLIPTMDILIAATSISKKMKLATLNHRHFQRIKDANVLEV